MGERSLTEIADAYGCDKGTVGPSRIFGGHNYTDIYEAYLAPMRGEALRILEIGIGVNGAASREYIAHGRNRGGGASLKMWHDYFPRAEIFAIDINPATHLDNGRVRTFVADQSDATDIGAVLSASGNAPFDFIIDDGSHRPDHQQASLGLLFPALKSGGIYFIEDLEENGAGDNAFGRHACAKVLNTRRVLKTFLAEGAFPSPNALGSTAYLAAHIARIGFHTPRASADPLSLFKKARNTKLRYKKGKRKTRCDCEEVRVGTVFFLLPSILLSGFMFPFRGMPEWAQWIGEVLPNTHFLRIVRGILLKGNGVHEMLPHIWPLFLFLLIVGTLAMTRYPRTLD